MNGHSPILAAVLAYSLSGFLVPEQFAQQSLSVVTAVLAFAVMDLRREVFRLRKACRNQANATQWLFGAVETIAPHIPGVKLLPFKAVEND